jgi:hypothetical protein
MPADDQPLPKLPDDYGKKQEFISKRSVEDLLTDTVVIGRRYRKFREFFAVYGDLVEELRNRLPKSGSKCKIGVKMPSGIVTPYSWSGFCEEFFGVCSERVRQELVWRKKWQDDTGVDVEMEESTEAPVNTPKTKVNPKSDEGLNLQQEVEDAKSQAAVATLASAVSQVEATKAKTVAVNYELAYRRLLDEMNSLLGKIEDYGDKCFPVYDYTRKLRPRLCAIEKIAAGAETVTEIQTTPPPPTVSGGELNVDEDELAATVAEMPAAVSDEAAELDEAMAMAASANALGEEVLLWA